MIASTVVSAGIGIIQHLAQPPLAIKEYGGQHQNPWRNDKYDEDYFVVHGIRALQAGCGGPSLPRQNRSALMQVVLAR